MLGLTLAAPPRRPLEVLCIGAHCDDIEIGCGGTVLWLQQQLSPVQDPLVGADFGAGAAAGGGTGRQGFPPALRPRGVADLRIA